MTPSPEGQPTKAKEAPPLEVRLAKKEGAVWQLGCVAKGYHCCTISFDEV